MRAHAWSLLLWMAIGWAGAAFEFSTSEWPVRVGYGIGGPAAHRPLRTRSATWIGTLDDCVVSGRIVAAPAAISSRDGPRCELWYTDAAVDTPTLDPLGDVWYDNLPSTAGG